MALASTTTSQSHAPSMMPFLSGAPRPLRAEVGGLFPTLSEELHQEAPWPTAPMQSGDVYIPGGLKSSGCTVVASRPWLLITWPSAKSPQKMAGR